MWLLLLLAVTGALPLTAFILAVFASYVRQFHWTPCVFTEAGEHERCEDPHWSLVYCFMHDEEDCSTVEQGLVHCSAAALCSLCGALLGVLGLSRGLLRADPACGYVCPRQRVRWQRWDTHGSWPHAVSNCRTSNCRTTVPRLDVVCRRRLARCGDRRDWRGP